MSAVTHVGGRHHVAGQHGDVLVSVEPRHEQDAQWDVQQDGHQDVGLPADRQGDRWEGRTRSDPAPCPSGTEPPPTSWSPCGRRPAERPASGAARFCSSAGRRWTAWRTGSAAGRRWGSWERRQEVRGRQQNQNQNWNRTGFRLELWLIQAEIGSDVKTSSEDFLHKTTRFGRE